MTRSQDPSSSKISDKQLKAALQSLREDVAAPADFRAKLMLRLEREGIVQAAAKAAAAPSRRWWQAFTPQRLALAASCALLLLVVTRFVPQPSAPALQGAAAPVVAALPVPAVARPAAAAPARVKAAAPAKDAPEELAAVGPVQESQGETQVEGSPAQQGALAVGSESAAAPQSSNRVSAPPQGQVSAAGIPATGAGAPLPGGGVSAADAKPTIVVIEPTATPMVKPLEGSSELRGNVIRAALGQSAVLIYRVPQSGHVHVEVFDRLGQSIAVLRDTDQSAGQYELHWGGQADSGSMAASGIYVMQLITPSYRTQHKLALVK
jgi:hypothetical protein